MGEISKSSYFQSIPGVNRSDDSIQFTHGERFISHFGDGLCPTQKVTAEAAITQQQARNTKKLCDDLNAAGEKHIRQAFVTRGKKIKYWREYLNTEVDKLAKQYEANEESLRNLIKNAKYFSDLARISQATADFRKNIDDADPNDDINKLLKEEMRIISIASDSMKQRAEELDKCQRKIQATRNGLMSEVEAKGMNLSINKRCQHAEPLLSFPYTPEDHHVDQVYHPNTEEQWEGDVAKKIENSVSARKEASDSCCRATDAIIKNHTDTAKAFYNTTKAIKESVQKTERAIFNVKDVLNTIVKSISASEQRIESFKNDLGTQSRLKTLELWRLQMLSYRPGPEHIRDGPVRKLEDELREIKKRNTFVSENLNQNTELIRKLVAQLEEKTLELEKLSRKQFIERENCLGIRRTILIEGMNPYDYVSN